MRIAVLTLTLRAAWAHSLKDKRMEVQSLLTRVRAKFNVSAAESGRQDDHQAIELTVAALAADAAQADSILDHVLQFVEAHTQAELVGAERELL